MHLDPFCCTAVSCLPIAMQLVLRWHCPALNCCKDRQLECPTLHGRSITVPVYLKVLAHDEQNFSGSLEGGRVSDASCEHAASHRQVERVIRSLEGHDAHVVVDCELGQVCGPRRGCGQVQKLPVSSLMCCLRQQQHMCKHMLQGGRGAQACKKADSLCGAASSTATLPMTARSTLFPACGTDRTCWLAMSAAHVMQQQQSPPSSKYDA